MKLYGAWSTTLHMVVKLMHVQVYFQSPIGGDARKCLFFVQGWPLLCFPNWKTELLFIIFVVESLAMKECTANCELTPPGKMIPSKFSISREVLIYSSSFNQPGWVSSGSVRSVSQPREHHNQVVRNSDNVPQYPLAETKLQFLL